MLRRLLHASAMIVTFLPVTIEQAAFSRASVTKDLQHALSCRGASRLSGDCGLHSSTYSDLEMSGVGLQSR